MASLEARLAAAFQRVAGVTGAPIDWAARLQAGLVAPQAILAATQAIPGILRFVTDAEAVAAISGAGALTPRQALMLLQGNPIQFPSLAALFTSALPEGALATVGKHDLGGGNQHRSSTWQKSNGIWYPTSNIAVEASTVAGVKAAANNIRALVVANNTKAILPLMTRVQDTFSGVAFIWDGANFVPRPGVLILKRWAQWSWGPFLNSNWTDPPYDSWYDPYNVGDPNTNGFIAPSTGKYRITGKIGFQGGCVPQRLIVAINSAGGERWMGLPSQLFLQTPVPFSMVFDAAAGSAWRVRLFKDGTDTCYAIAGTNNTGDAAYTSEHTIEYLGPLA